MDDRQEDSISLNALERTLRDADPEALLVPPRILRRVIKREEGLAFLGFHASRHSTYVIAGEALRALVEIEELGLPSTAAWPRTALLILEPEAEELTARNPNDVLLDLWRRLFHARVVAEMRHLRIHGSLDDTGLADRIERIGVVEFDEIRAVLKQEGYLFPHSDDAHVYEQFAAVFLELRHFAPALLPHVFPGIDDVERVEALLAADVAAEALLKATRLAGAPDPRPWNDLTADDDEGSVEPEPSPAVPSEMPRGRLGRTILRAEAASRRGNDVRAAILRWQAARPNRSLLSESIQASARAELDRLVGRLQAALEFDDAEAERWRRALPALLDRAARGFWTPEGRLLYDLQRVCVDHEREVFRFDVIDWLRTFARRPLRRSLPHLREVMISNHLRGASGRLQATRLARADRDRLAHLLHRAVNRAEHALRDRFRPVLASTLEKTGIRPRNLPERVAHRKLVEELLDRIVGRGFLTIGDLRDACSRSNLKLEDLAGPMEFFRGDRLLRTDHALGGTLDGVYRRGEVYLRWLQRLSALAFANPVGRFVTLYVALPYGGAFLILEGLQHLFGPLLRVASGLEIHLMNPASMAVLGTVALGLVNFIRFRGLFLKMVRVLGRAARAVLVEWPARLLRIPIVRRVLESPIAIFVWKYGLKPFVATIPFWFLWRWLGIDSQRAGASCLVIFALMSLLINTRLGRDAEEMLADGAVRFWRQVCLDILPGLFRLVMQFFNRVHEDVERVLYAVDEWLRFRAGQRRSMLVVKVALGAVWFVIAYLVRIYVNLLIEPQVNPIKHFPVVTVSHKLMLFYIPRLTKLLAAPLIPLVGSVVGNFVAGTTVLLLPGVFGFLVWELKENWRLYEANRAERLKPVIVGSHGETLARLLRPGLHSGTLPKLFARLRRSERRLLLQSRERAALKHREALHHVEEEIRRFVDRDFLALAGESLTLGPIGIALEGIEVATNRVRVALSVPRNETPLCLVFELRRDWLVGAVADPGWASTLSEARRRALTTALAGFFTMGGVELVPTRDPRAARSLRTAVALLDRRSSALPTSSPVIDRFDRETIYSPFHPEVATWSRWVEAWELDQRSAHLPTRIIGDLRLLPPSETPGRQAKRKRATRRRR